MTARAVTLAEWSSCGFEENEALRDLDLAPADSQLAEALTKSERLKVVEHRRGLRLQATSFVGRIGLGDLVVTIEPKIARHALLRLLEYAYDLGDLHLFKDARYGANDVVLVDVIVQTLLREVERLRERGLHRTYTRVSEDLATPRGAIDMRSLVSRVTNGTALLPCVHHPRDDDHLLNRVLKAGLLLGAHVAFDGAIRVAARRSAATLEKIATVSVSSALLARARRALDRRVVHYAPMLNLVEILLGGNSLDLDEEDQCVEVPGFLFDMNRFWQALLGRLLRESLPDAEIVEDRALREAFRYADGFGHPTFRAPTARPDFVVRRGGRCMAVLDAKYRDLWKKNLPSSMLYQLAVYAAARGSGRTAAILYPAPSAEAREVRVEVCSLGVGTSERPVVALRPVHVERLVAAIDGGDGARREWGRELAGVPTLSP